MGKSVRYLREVWLVSNLVETYMEGVRGRRKRPRKEQEEARK